MGYEGLLVPDGFEALSLELLLEDDPDEVSVLDLAPESEDAADEPGSLFFSPVSAFVPLSLLPPGPPLPARA
ncbi:MAG: hypothetical protein U5J83_04255 [Bryobacterales bacterium]|nr:hypothetical protein [Bryobacterales bacterium]